MNEKTKWLVQWFASRGELPEVEDLGSANYFELGLIDSFGVFELIEAVESHYKIRFTQDHFEQRRFATIRGLAEIITELETSEAHGTLQ